VGAAARVTTQVEETSNSVVVEVQQRRAIAGSERADALLSGHLGLPVRLTTSVPDQAWLHRRLPEEQGLVPDCLTMPFPVRRWSPKCPVPGQAPGSWTSGRCTC